MASATVVTPPEAALTRGESSTGPIELQPLGFDKAGPSSPLPSEQAETGDDATSATAQAARELENLSRPTGTKFIALYTCILLGAFFTGYDTSCVATLTPVITDQFHTLDNLGWYAIVYLLAGSATLLIYGQLYSFYSMKKLWMGSLGVFLIGSVICAAAPSSPAFIVGRALSGLGSAGIFAGMNILITNITTVQRRPIYMAACGAVECTSLAFGPFISGAIARYSTWRVAFYILIPIGAIIIITSFLTMDDIRRPENAGLSAREKLRRLDLLGFAVNVPMVFCLVLGLQWAGSEYSWSSWRIVAQLAIAAVLFLVLLAVEYRSGENSMIPLKMLRQRTVAFGSLVTFCNVGALCVIAYYLPIYFQAVRGATTFGSGLMYLPTAVPMALFALAAGPIVTHIGYFTPVLIAGSIFMAIGTGLITTLEPESPASKWVTYQIIYGIGVSLSFQIPFTAVSTVLPPSKSATALILVMFTQQTGGIVALSIAQNVYLNQLANNLAAIVPGFNAKDILDHGALEIVHSIPEKYHTQVLQAYNSALQDVFYIAVALVCVIFLCSLGMEWKSVKEEKQE